MPIKCYTTKEIAEILGKTERQVINYIKKRQMKGYKGMSVKEGWLVPESEFLTFCYIIATKNKKAFEFIAKMIREKLPETEIKEEDKNAENKDKNFGE